MRTRGSADLLENRRLRAVAMLQRGRRASEVACDLEVNRKTVWRWWTTFKAHGAAGLKARPVPGRPANSDRPAVGRPKYFLLGTKGSLCVLASD